MEFSKESFPWQNVCLGSNSPRMKIPKTKGEAGLLPITGAEFVGNRPHDMSPIGSRQCFDWQVGGKIETISLLFGGLYQLWKGNSRLW